MASHLVRDWGNSPHTNSLQFLLNGATDAQVPDILESWFTGMRDLLGQVERASGVYYTDRSPALQIMALLAPRVRDRVNEILDDHDVAWQVVGEKMIPRSSVAMHATIVEPLFALTSGDSRYASVEKAYQKALQELKPGGDPQDAITDAGTALQEMPEVVGAKGNDLGRLLVDARKRVLLARYDSKLAEAVDLIGEWISADRSERGDAHHVRDASQDDAWLAVRISGALILRLGAGRKR